jgi:hypothetical protein
VQIVISKELEVPTSLVSRIWIQHEHIENQFIEVDKANVSHEDTHAYFLNNVHYINMYI